MKLLLITASSPEIRKIRRSRFLNFQQITMPYLAALTPPHWQVEHIDEEVGPVDFNARVDLVGITSSLDTNSLGQSTIINSSAHS